MKIQTIMLGKIGDMICLTSIFPLIKQKYPESKIDVIASPLNEIVIRNNPHVDKIIVYNKKPLKILKTILSVRKVKYDFHINPKDHISTESKIFARLSIAKIKVGYDLPDTKIFDKLIANSEDNYTLHFNERIYNAFSVLDLDKPNNIPTPEIYPNYDSIQRVNDFIDKNIFDDELIVLNISASNNRKMWHNKNWEQLINDTVLKNKKIVLCFVPAHLEKAKDLMKRLPNLIPFYSKTVDDVFALIQKAAYLITNDTAVVHCASAFNTPLFALFNGIEWSYNKFSPLSTIQEIIKAAKGEEYTDEIEPERVINAFKRFSTKLEKVKN